MKIMSKSKQLRDKKREHRRKKINNIANHNGRPDGRSKGFVAPVAPSVVSLCLGIIGKVGGKKTPLEDER